MGTLEVRRNAGRDQAGEGHQSQREWLNYDYTTFAAVGETLFFPANDGVNGLELWKSDGTEAGTVMVKDIVPGSGGSTPEYLTNVNGTLMFTLGLDRLWKSDGTEAGTVLVKDIRPGNGSPLIFDIVPVGGLGYFVADDGTHGREVWRTDGTETGTFLLRDITSGSGSEPKELTAVGDTAYWIQGLQLWKSDGSTTGTVLVKDFFSLTGSITELAQLTGAGGTLFFSAKSPANGNELWKSDGTTAGPSLSRTSCPERLGRIPLT
jgi:ELWxxDGT repeat protein